MFKRSVEKTEVTGKSKKGWIVFFVVLGIIVLAGGIFFWKAGSVFNKISTGGGFLKNITGALPGVNKDELKGEKEDRINILALGMRGENVPGGGTLADTIIVISVKVKENKVSMISVPRDLYVDNPALGTKSKINAVYAYGEQKQKGQGLVDMKKVVGDITGLEIPYGAVINFKGFSDLVNAIGGVDIDLKEPFSETEQFNQAHVCDSFFTIPTGEFEYKYYTRSEGTRYVSAQYPLCRPDPSTLECGGTFSLPAGKQTLDGEKALCYVRSRYITSDFDRAKRQQIIIQQIKEKTLSLGTLADFGKVNDIINSLGNNAQTDMQIWEMKRMLELYKEMNNPQIFHRVLENSEAGLLYKPADDKYPGAGYIVLPIGDNYDKIREMVKNIFSLPPQAEPEIKKESGDASKTGTTTAPTPVQNNSTTTTPAQ